MSDVEIVDDSSPDDSTDSDWVDLFSETVSDNNNVNNLQANNINDEDADLNRAIQMSL